MAPISGEWVLKAFWSSLNDPLWMAKTPGFFARCACINLYLLLFKFCIYFMHVCCLYCHFTVWLWGCNMWLRNISHFIEICLLFAVAMPTIGQLLYQVDPDHRIAYRKYERTCLKLINTNNAVMFNRTCLIGRSHCHFAPGATYSGVTCSRVNGSVTGVYSRWVGANYSGVICSGVNTGHTAIYSRTSYSGVICAWRKVAVWPRHY